MGIVRNAGTSICITDIEVPLHYGLEDIMNIELTCSNENIPVLPLIQTHSNRLVSGDIRAICLYIVHFSVM